MSQDCGGQDDAVEVCPICLSLPSDALPFCTAPCCHRFCAPDAERIVMNFRQNSTEVFHRQVGNHLEAPHLLLPTLGACPICRQSFSLFELITGHGKEFLHKKNLDINEWPIVDKTFSELNGCHCFSFERSEGPKYRVAEEEVRAFPFKPGSHFHTASRTFHGEVVIQNEEGGDCCGVVILQFSTDFQRITVGAIMLNRIIVEYFGVGGRMLHALSPSGLQEQPQYHGDRLWGNVFYQDFKNGLASFQFLSLEECYISYEHTLCRQFPPLDDGSPIPNKVLFHNISFVEGDRIFRGEIWWDEDYGTTWQGFQKWKYEIKFDSYYTLITSGTVKSFFCDSEEPREMASFEQDLNYINAAIGERLKKMIDDDQKESGESAKVRFMRISRRLRHTLECENVAVQTNAMIQDTLTRIIAGKLMPIEYCDRN